MKIGISEVLILPVKQPMTVHAYHSLIAVSVRSLRWAPHIMMEMAVTVIMCECMLGVGPAEYKGLPLLTEK